MSTNISTTGSTNLGFVLCTFLAVHIGSNNSTLFFIFCYLFFGRHGSCVKMDCGFNLWMNY